jgi:hypothetical protein
MKRKTEEELSSPKAGKSTKSVILITFDLEERYYFNSEIAYQTVNKRMHVVKK